ncbi:GspE/PulE family protein [Limisphaera sp. VF-2]|jgi:general secretion pathway protein E|uniref:GspE/PulE family protein n=1 Tax=Limisphaera sp. VF-2 TaxID=3400418 RepID=UPI0025669227|nr:GspE/PulE family protein [Limisphaera sp.]
MSQTDKSSPVRPVPGPGSLEPDTDAPALLERLVQWAEQSGASDIHFQPAENCVRVFFRLDGVLTPVTDLPGALAERLSGRIKYLARLKTWQTALPQDGRIDHSEVGTAHDIRVSTYPTVTGERIVLRLFRKATLPDLQGLGFPEAARKELEHFLQRPAGLLLLTGPAGSGKTTTIYACLQHLVRTGNRHIITIEDPVEQILPGVTQTEIQEALGLDFARAARHLLRQDPEVLVVGEIRDEETAQIVVRAALTGHLVLSTLHAGSCRGVLERLRLMCRDAYTAVSAVELILNQRLVRRLCGQCDGRGCDACMQTGYRGRIPVVEWYRVTESARARLREGDWAVVAPDPSLADAARGLIARGWTTTQEVQRVVGP